MAVIGIALFALLFRLALSHTLEWPVPGAPDELAYALGGDLFASGKIAGPVHPHWKFLESAHVLSVPAYAPKYPPGQSLFLAIGTRLFGHAYFGVILSVSLFAAAVCWMLQVWVRPAWSIFGGVCVVLYFGAGHYWMESYWGGAVAGLGAALAIGAYGRLVRRHAAHSGWLLAAGGFLLMTTRPYESLGLLATLAVSLVVKLRRQWRLLAPAAAGALLFGALLLAYNYRVTGNALQMPYMLHMRQYSANPPFWFLDPWPPKHYENRAMEQTFAIFERDTYEEIKSKGPLGSVAHNLLTIAVTVGYDGGIAILLPLIFLPLLRFDRDVRLFSLCAVLLLAQLVAETFMFMHYMAPLIVVAVLLACMVLERLWGMRGIAASQRAGLVFTLMLCLVAAPLWRGARAIAGQRGALYLGDGFGPRRERVAQDILRHPGGHVVFVGFAPGQQRMHPWVANGANIDSARLVWAHDRGKENGELQRYFAGRTFWYLTDYEGEVTLTRVQ